MASGSNYLTTYYAKRIIGDTAAATSTAALLQTGSGITTNTWILHRTNRASTYGIHYLYDSTANGTADKIEFYGGQRDADDTMDVASAWIQLDTGDASFNDIIGNGTLTIESTSILYGDVTIGCASPIANLLVYGNIYSGTTDQESTHSIVARSKSGIISIYSDYIASTNNYSRGLYFGPNTIDNTTYAGYAAIASATNNTTTFRLYNANVNKYTTIIADGKDDYQGITYGNRQWTIPMANGNRIFVGTHSDNYPYNSMGVVYAVNGGSNASTYVLTTPRVKLYNHIQIATSRNDTDVDIRVTGLVIYGNCYGNTAAHLVSNTAGVFRYMDGGPQLIFAGNGADPFGAAADQPQIGALIFTDNDQAGTGVSFHFVSNQSSDNTGGNLTVTAPRFRARKGLTIGQNTDNTSYKLYVNGQTFLNNTTAASSTNLSSQLIVANTDETGTAIELWRNEKASWQIMNDSGTLYIRNNWTTAKQSTYSQNGLIMDYNTGAASLPYLALGQTTRNTSYKLYVNGTSYFYGNILLKANQYRADNGGINANNSDIINVNSISFNDVADTFNEGIMFYRNGSAWECLAANDKGFFIRQGTDGSPALSAANANGNLFASAVWGSKVVINSDWVGFYAAAGDTTTRYGYVQANANRMYFRKENGVSSYGFDFNSHLYTTGSYYAANNGPQLSLACQDLTNLNASNNGLSANRESGGVAFYTKDYGVWTGNVGQGYTQSNGQLWGRIYIRNHKTDGTNVNNYIYLYANKDGTTSYSIANQAAFRDAITAPSKTGGGASGTWGISITGHASSDLALSGGTMTGNITMTAGKSIVRAGVSRSWINGRDTAIIRTTSYSGYDAILSMKTTNGAWELGVYTSNICYFVYTPDTQYNAGTNSSYNNSVNIRPEGKIYAAVWNDYAEYRKDNQDEKDKQQPGRCVAELGDGSLSLSTMRLQRGCEIISDTFGFAIGENQEEGYSTPVAISGRVLAYPYESIEEFENHIGYAVCSGPDGTVSIMTQEEEKEYPACIIGTISEIPNYTIWGTGKVKVNNRVWIRIR